MYWQIGKVIFEEEQADMERADYGQFLIKSISNEFQPLFGSGFTVRQLEMNRQFYRSFPIVNALRSQFNWTHYRTPIRIDNEDKRAFYIAETEKNNWTAWQLDRQINSQLFECLLLSNDMQALLAMAFHLWPGRNAFNWRAMIFLLCSKTKTENQYRFLHLHKVSD